MTIGLIITQFRTTEKSKDPGIIAASLVKLGHEVILYCLATDISHFSGVTVKTISRNELNSHVFWAAEKPTAFLIYSWLSLRYSRLIKILKEKNKIIILKLDSDGHLIYPLKPSYLRVWGLDSSLKAKFSHLLRLGQWFLFPKIISRRKIVQIARADAVIIESPLASENLKKSLASWHQENLNKKIFFIPNPLPLIPQNLNAPRENLIISVGRWHDKRKNAAGIIKTFSVLKNPGWKILLIGRGSSELKNSISKNNPNLEIRTQEFIAPEIIGEYYQQGKIFFAPSVADSFNLAAASALSYGLSLAATPLESFQYFAANGRYGTASEDLIQALETEINKWGNNSRNPQEISAYWQSQLNPDKIGQEIEKLIKSLC